MKYFVLLCCVILLSLHQQTSAQDCEVCEKFLNRLADKLKNENIEKEPQIKAELKQLCKSAKGKENRFCYYIGATEDAATTMMNEVTRPLSNHLPVSLICKKLKKKDSQICELKYEKQIDWKNVNLQKMRVKQLRKILGDWGEECRGCIEKSEFIQRINDLKPKYVHQEL